MNFIFADDVRRKKGKVLIHCRAGVSRSVTIAAAYLLYYSNSNTEEVLSYIKKKRPIAGPNINFVGQLYQFDCETWDYVFNSTKWIDLDTETFAPAF